MVIWCTLKYQKCQKWNSDPLINQAKSFGLPISETITLENITKAINDIRKQIQELHREAEKNQDQHLINCLNLARKLSQEENTSIIKRIINSEKKIQQIINHWKTLNLSTRQEKEIHQRGSKSISLQRYFIMLR